jgi:DNA methyltransferase 1-associated protein 1
VRGLLNRTPEQIAEEEALFLLCKRLEQTERRFARDRETLLRHLAGIDSGLPNLPLDDEPFSALAQQQAAESSARPNVGSTSRNRTKRKGDMAELDSPGGATPPAAKKINLAKQALDDERHCIIRTDTGGPANTKSAHQAAYLRTQKIPQPKSSAAARVRELLTEMSIKSDKLVMPTRDTCAQMENLLDATNQLLEAKRSLDRVESEIRVMRQKRGEPVDVDMGEA